MDLLERKLKFHLNKEFEAPWGTNLGQSIRNCTASQTNSLRCEVQHTEKPDWRMWTVTEFYNIGCIQISHLPFKDDLTVKKYYERLTKAGKQTSNQLERR